MRAEVMNAGVSGFSTAEALVFLENEGVRYEPDAVVLGFSSNDYADNWKAALYALDAEGRLREQKTEHIPGVSIQDVIYGLPGVRWLSENSYFYSLLFNGVWSHFKSRLAQQAKARAHEASGARSGEGGSFEYVLAGGSAVSSERVALAAALVERMDRFCEERGIRLLVVDIPTRPGPFRAGSSLRPALLARMGARDIEYMDSKSSLGPYEGVAEMHVRHGHNHISEFTHTVLGVLIGRRLLERDSRAGDGLAVPPSSPDGPGPPQVR